MPYVKNFIPYPFIRFYIVSLLVSCPILSFTLGKAKAVSIYTNKKIRYISATANNTKMDIKIKAIVFFKTFRFFGR